MLSMADPLGRVNASVPGLAHMSRVPLPDTQKALEIFMAPDQFSRSKDHDGRRIEEITGGWQLLNYKMYRELRDDEIRKEQNRIAQENWRNKNKQNKQSKPEVSHDKPQSAQEEVEEEVEVESTKTTTLASTAIAVPAARGKLVCTLPLNQGDHEVFEADVQEWVPLYPAVDIRQELRNMKGWLLGNPKLRKTKTGIGRFINAWFSRAQNESRPGAGNGTFNRSHGKTGGNLDALATTLALIDQRDQQAANEVCGAETGTGEPIDTFDLRGRSSELSAGGYRSGVTLDLIPPPR
jgi:hypothetical protein